MPPIRSMPSSKPMKTERTHEENQERAYIAASRRSDRSLEARLESARRASEIHKKRTGRGLRVTEQDVINEEMYEEEDEDLPAQYRRLTAHLHSHSLEFNRRFQAYVSSTIGARMAIANYDPSLTNQPAPQQAFAQQLQQHPQQQQQYPNTSYVNPHVMQMIPAHMFSPQVMDPTIQPQYPQMPYVQQPFLHQRSASIATPQPTHNYQQQFIQMQNQNAKLEEQRRMSLPNSAVTTPMIPQTPAVRPEISQTPASTQAPQESPQHSPLAVNKSSPSSDASNTQQQTEPPLAPQFATNPNPPLPGDSQVNASPFSMALPGDAQLAMASHFHQTGLPYQLMSGSDQVLGQGFFNYNGATSRFNNAPEKTTASQGYMLNGTSVDATTTDGCTPSLPTATNNCFSQPYTQMFTNNFFDSDYAQSDLKPVVSRQNSVADSANDTEWNAQMDQYVDLDSSFTLDQTWQDGDSA